MLLHMVIADPPSALLLALVVLFFFCLTDFYRPHVLTPTNAPAAAASGASATAARDGDKRLDKLVTEDSIQLYLAAYILIVHIVSICYVDWRSRSYPGSALMPREMLGAIVGIGGGLLRVWSRVVLGRMFTFEVGIRKDHRLVEDGPYKHILHPSYTGAVMLHCGFDLLIGSYLLAAVDVAVQVAFLYSRVKAEEAVLETEFGEHFRARKRRVARFLPYVF